jgi:signal transduction histidine kinase
MPDRPSFRRRLTVRLGVGLAVALGLIGVSVWAGAVLMLRHQANGALRAEVAAVARSVVTDDGAIHPAGYSWDEPHHRFDTEHINPYFLQLFDARGRLLRASENIALFPPGTFPARLLPATSPSPFAPLVVFEADGHTLYRATHPLPASAGPPLGYVQLSLYAPPIRQTLRRLALGLLVGLSLVYGALLALVWTVGGRVVRPLQSITRQAQALSAQTLGDRIPVPAGADRETAALAAALNGAIERLDGAFAEMRRFTANAAHELQTPLTVLLGHIEVALRREREPDAYRSTLAVLQKQVDGLVQTVRGLLALARLDNTAEALPTESVDLADLVRAEAEAARPHAEARGLTLRFTARAPALVRGNAPLLREVARNLIDNAVTYTERGHVAIEVARAGAHVVLTVADTGIGIDRPELATDRFWRSDAVQHIPGSGLGLALVARTVAAHGGTLALKPAPGGGTVARVTLDGDARGSGDVAIP